MNLNKIKESLDYLVIFLLVFGFYSVNVYNGTELEILTKRKEILFILLVPILLKVFIERNKIFELLKNKKNRIIIIILLLCMLGLKNYYLNFICFMLALSFQNREKVLKFLLITLITFYLMTISCYFLNIFNPVGTPDHFKDYGYFVLKRYNLGFYHPNNPMMLLLSMIFLFYYIYDKIISKKIMSILFIVLSTIVFCLTISRTSYLLIFLFCGEILIPDKYIEKLRGIFYIESVVIIFISCFLPIFYINKKLDFILSGRLELFRYYLKNNTISLLGNKEIVHSYSTYPLDNVYLRVLFENGIIGISILIFIIWITLNVLFKYKNYKAIRILSIILIYSLTESQGLEYYFNILIFVLPVYLIKYIKE